ncbi:hypothetical protein Tco_0435496 [Tanacetum coccineum]
MGKRGRDTKILQSGGPPIKVGDEAVHKELGDRMERAVTTASSLEVEHDSAILEKATARTSANGEVELIATIDGQEKTITKASLRRHLKLEDNGGVTTLPNSKIFEQLALMRPPETSPSRITSSPSLSPQHTPVSTLSTLQPPNTQPTPNAEEAVQMTIMNHLLHSVTSLGNVMRDLVVVLESELKQTRQTGQDVMDLYRLVEERYATSRPERYDLILWGDLKILFQPNEEDEVWRHQHEYNLISWRREDVELAAKEDPFIWDFTNIKFRGGLLGLKVFLMLFEVTAALIDVNVAQSKLVLLENFNENYSKCLRLLVKLQLPVQSYYC